MKEKEGRELKPFVTVEQMARFKSDCPETYTESRIINELCIAREEIGCDASGEDLARHLGLNRVHLSGAVRIITGYNLGDLLCAVNRELAIYLHTQHPTWKAEQIAHAAGYRDHSTLYNAVGRKTYDRLFAKFTHRQS